MSARVYEELLEVASHELEAIALTLSSPKEHLSAYPLPYLTKQSAERKFEINALVLENDFVKALIAPALGGRILSFIDKAAGVDVLGWSGRLPVEEGGARGVESVFGIRWSLGTRLNDLGPVDYQIVEPDEDDSAAGVILFELTPGKPLSLHVSFSLEPGARTLDVEMRYFNRGFSSQPIEPSLFVGVKADAALQNSSGGGAIYSAEADSGVHFGFGQARWEVLMGRPDVVKLHPKTITGGWLGPHQLDRARCSLTPLVGLSTVLAVSNGLAFSIDGATRSVKVVSTQNFAGKIVLLVQGRGPVEAPLELQAGIVMTLPLGDMDCIGAVVLDQLKQEVLRWNSSQDAERPEKIKAPIHPHREESLLSQAARAIRNNREASTELNEAEHVLGLRSAALALKAMDELRKGNFSDASENLENALLYNGEDHLIWWMKGMAARLAGSSEEDHGELLNAHFLAPVEPVLRAEAFLRQEVTAEGASPLVAPLSDNPDAMIETACLLFDCGNFGDLTKWIYECLKHRDTPMLRYILAAALVGKNLHAEAAQQLKHAASAGIRPPYPWRAAEIHVLVLLRQVFPKDEGVLQLFELATAVGLAPS